MEYNIVDTLNGLERCLDTLIDLGEKEKAITILNEVERLRKDYIATGHSNVEVSYYVYDFIRKMCDKIYTK